MYVTGRMVKNIHWEIYAIFFKKSVFIHSYLLKKQLLVYFFIH